LRNFTKWIGSDDDSTNNSNSLDKGMLSSRKITQVLSSRNGKKYIFDFAIHIQKPHLGRYLLFVLEAKKIKVIPEDIVRVSKTWLLYQKYLDIDSFLWLGSNHNQMEDLEQLKKIILLNMEKMGSEEVRKSFSKESTNLMGEKMDIILNALEQDLLHQLFKPFFKSAFYEKLIKEIQLSEGLQEIERMEGTDG